MIYLPTILTPPKDAETLLFAPSKELPPFTLQRRLVHVVIQHGTLALVLRGVKVVVEVAVMGRVPWDVGPAHAGLERGDLGYRGARNHGEGCVAAVEVGQGRWDVVGEEGAADAARVP